MAKTQAPLNARSKRPAGVNVYAQLWTEICGGSRDARGQGASDEFDASPRNMGPTVSWVLVSDSQANTTELEPHVAMALLLWQQIDPENTSRKDAWGQREGLLGHDFPYVPGR